MLITVQYECDLYDLISFIRKLNPNVIIFENDQSIIDDFLRAFHDAFPNVAAFQQIAVLEESECDSIITDTIIECDDVSDDDYLTITYNQLSENNKIPELSLYIYQG